MEPRDPLQIGYEQRFAQDEAYRAAYEAYQAARAACCSADLTAASRTKDLG